MSDVSALAAQMPLLARTLGVWEGTYTRVDPEGKVLDRHRSRLTCSWLPDGTYLQVNEYTWDNGRREVIRFPATVSEGRLHFDTERILGDAREIGPTTMVLNWVYKHDPTGFLWELITLSDDFNRKSRVWQHFDGSRLVAVTVIKEERVR
jgi:hypothetical protein